MTARYLQTGVVLIHRTDRTPSRWCALRSADVGDRLMTTCLSEIAYDAVHVQAVRPGERLPHNTCPQCKRHVEVSLNGACVPVESVRTTRDLRKRLVQGTPWAAEDAANEQDWDEGAIPELVLRDMTSRGVAK